MNKRQNSKILIILFCCLLAAIAVFFYDFSSEVSKVAKENNRDRLKEFAQNNVSSMKQKLYRDQTFLEGIAFQISRIDNVTGKEAIDYIHEINKKMNFLRMAIDLPDGRSYTSDYKEVDVSDMGYLPSVLKGESVVTELILTKVENKPSFAQVVPIYKEDKIVGALRSVYMADSLSFAIDSMAFNGEGYFSVFNSDGDYLYIPENTDKLGIGSNIYDIFTQDLFQSEVNRDQFQRELEAGKSGFIDFTVGKENLYAYYMPLGIHKWYMMSIVNKDFVNNQSQDINSLAFILLIKLSFVFILLIATIAYVFRKSMNQIKDSKNYFENVLNNIPTPVTITDNENHIAFMNTASLELSGKNMEDVLEESYDVWKMQNGIIPDSRMERESNEHNVMSYAEYKGKHYLVNTSVLYNPPEEKAGSIIVFQDVTKIVATQNELQSLSNNIPGGVVKYSNNEEGTLEYFSEGFVELMGYTKEEIAEYFGNSFWNIISERDRERVSEEIEAQLKNGRSVESEYRIQTKSGRECWVLHNGELIEEHRRKLSFYSVLIDVTSRKNTKKILEEKTMQLESVSENLDGGIVITLMDSDKTITYMNPGYLRLINYTEEQLREEKGYKAFNLFCPEDIDPIKKLILARMEEGDTVSLEHRIVRRGGSVIWVSSKGRRFVDESGIEKVLWVAVDVTDMKEAEQRLRISEERYRIAVQNTENIIFDFEVNGRILHHSAQMEKIFGVKNAMMNAPESVIKQGVVAEESTEQFRMCFQKIIEGEAKASCEIKTKTMEGVCCWYEMILTNLYDDKKRPLRAVGTLHNITAQREAELQIGKELVFRDAMLKDTIDCYELNFTMDCFISGLEKWKHRLSLKENTSYSYIIERIGREVIYEDDQKRFMDVMSYKNIMAAFHKHQFKFVIEYRRREENGGVIWAEATMHLIENPKEHEIRGICYIKDINAEKERELSLQEKAEKDQLTGLLNKITTEQTIDDYLGTQEAKECKGALMMIDLDNFKEVNDQLGHAAGDEVLKTFSKTLMNLFRKSDFIGRVGGDEFIVYMRNIYTVDTAKNRAKEVCEFSRKVLGDSEKAVKLSATVGIVLTPEHGISFKELYKKADLALYHAKRRGKDGYCFYYPGLSD